MSRYMAIRDCYTSERFYQKGTVYDLADKMVKHPKNFSPVDVAAPPGRTVAEPVVELTTAAKTTEMVAPVQADAPAVPKGKVKCSVCGKVVSTRGATGHSRSHKKEKDGSTNKKTG